MSKLQLGRGPAAHLPQSGRTRIFASPFTHHLTSSKSLLPPSLFPHHLLVHQGVSNPQLHQARRSRLHSPHLLCLSLSNIAMQANPVAPPWRSNGPTAYPSNPVHGMSALDLNMNSGSINTSLVGPAFTTVSARRTLPRQSSPLEPVYIPSPVNQPSNHASASASPPAKRKVDWPTPVRQYVQRSFIPENTIPGIGREDMERKLKEVITKATEMNSLDTTDWENLALPQQMIEEERKRAMTATTPWPALGWHQPPPPLQMQPVTHFRPEPSKKRKSSELDPDEDSNQPPWRKTNNRNVFEDRISYPPNDARQRQDTNPKTSSKSQAKLEKRKKRFENGRSGFQSPGAGGLSRDESPVPKAPLGPVVGRCLNLEKPYLRLTSEPNPEKVRPLHILEQTLELLRTKWTTEHNYPYICDQFKSLRQDLTVQHIKSEFTVKVYETHARIALEKGDLGEYNQCQTQLRGLYSENLGGHPREFLAYRILYFINIQNRTELNDVLAHLTPADKEDRAVKHALGVRSSLALGNYHRFFQLYLAPDLAMGSPYLMDRFVGRERLAAMAIICKGYVFSVLRVTAY
jgi:SAC3 family protein LENG8/THP3